MCQMEVENSFFFNNLTKRFLFCVHESLLHTYCFARLFTSPVYSHRSRPPLNPFYIIVNRSPLMVMGKKNCFWITLYLVEVRFALCTYCATCKVCVCGYGCFFFVLFREWLVLLQFFHTECNDKGKEKNAQHKWQHKIWYLVTNWSPASCNKTSFRNILTGNLKRDVLLVLLQRWVFQVIWIPHYIVKHKEQVVFFFLC